MATSRLSFGVGGPVDLAHPPGAEALGDVVVAVSFPDHGWMPRSPCHAQANWTVTLPVVTSAFTGRMATR